MRLLPLLCAAAVLLPSHVMSQTPSLPNAAPWDQPFLPPAPAWDGASRDLLRDASDPWVTPFEADPAHDFSPTYADTRAWFDRLDAASELIRIEQFGVSPEGLVPNLLAFNVGVEIGQLLALSAILILMSYWRRTDSFWKHAYTANVIIMTAGFMLIGYQLTGYALAK